MNELFPNQSQNQHRGNLARMAAEAPVAESTPQLGRLAAAANRLGPMATPELTPPIGRLAAAANLLGTAVIVNETDGSKPGGNDHFEGVFPGQEDRMINPYFNRRGR